MSLVHNLARELADGGPVLPTSDSHVSPRNPPPLKLSAHYAQVPTQVPSHAPSNQPVKLDSRPVTETNPDSIYVSPSPLTPSSQVKTHHDPTIVSPPTMSNQTPPPTKLFPTKKSTSPCKKFKSRPSKVKSTPPCMRQTHRSSKSLSSLRNMRLSIRWRRNFLECKMSVCRGRKVAGIENR